MKLHRIVAALAAVPLFALAACGGSGSDSASDKPSSAAGSSTGGNGSTVNIDFWGWAPGYQESVDEFNKTHDNIKVHFTKVQSGSQGGYQKMLTAVTAGNAPCLGQVGYETANSFAVEDALMDVTDIAAKDKDKYVDWAWNQMSAAGKVFGAPVDTGPMAMFYRADIFEKYGIAVPKTWDEFKKAGETLKQKAPTVKLSSIDTGLYNFAGKVWQNGGRWWGMDGDAWTVTMTDPATLKVANYWQSLMDEGLLFEGPSFDNAWNKMVADGTLASFVGAAWASGLIPPNAPDAKGKWRVAPMPVWNAGDKAAGNEGGSGTAVLKGCKAPEAAWEFANWMSTDPASVKNLINVGGMFPASKPGLESPELKKSSDYFGGEVIWDVFKDAAANTDPNWVWGPTMTQVSTDLADAFNSAFAGKTTLPEALKTVQDKTVANMKSKGLSVK